MEITGKLVYDPLALATGRDRKRIIRRHIQELHVLTRAYTPHLRGKLKRIANRYDQVLHDDPWFWLRSNPPADMKHIEEFYNFSKEVAEQTDINVSGDFSKLLNKYIRRVEEDLVITRKRSNWAILKVSRETIRPFFDQIRSDGTCISPSVWGPHISVIRGERRPNRDNWYVDHGKSFTITIDEKIKRNRKGYFWVHATSKELEKVRTSMGLPPRPSPPFHLTIGKLQ